MKNIFDLMHLLVDAFLLYVIFNRKQHTHVHIHNDINCDTMTIDNATVNTNPKDNIIKNYKE